MLDRHLLHGIREHDGENAVNSNTEEELLCNATPLAEESFPTKKKNPQTKKKIITGTPHAYYLLIEHLLASGVRPYEEPEVRHAFILDALHRQQKCKHF